MSTASSRKAPSGTSIPSTNGVLNWVKCWRNALSLSWRAPASPALGTTARPTPSSAAIASCRRYTHEARCSEDVRLLILELIRYQRSPPERPGVTQVALSRGSHVRFRRRSGILLHPTSLPGRYGIGDLGNEAYRFVDFLVAAQQSLWQILPLGPTGYGDSPYQCLSAFAGNPLLISPDLLVIDGLLTPAEVRDVPSFPAEQVAFSAVIPFKH